MQISVNHQIDYNYQQNYTQMLRSLSTILSSTSSTNSSVTKIYDYHPGYRKGLNRVKKKLINNQNSYEKSKIYEGLLDFMLIPIEKWIIQFQPVLNNFTVKQYLYNQIIRHSTSYKAKQQGYSVIGKNITQDELDELISHPKIIIHNTFILLNQYKILDEFIINLNSQQLEMLIDGICYVYLYYVKKEEDIGQNAQSQHQENLGTVDEVTCLLHYIITHTGLYTNIRPKKEHYSLMKQINILNMPNFVKIYDQLQNNKKIDNIINSIPMFMQLLAMMVKHKNSNISGCQFILNIKWLSGLGVKVLEIIKYNINKILLLSNQHQQNLSEQELKIVSQLQHMNQVYQKQNSRLVNGMSQKANQLREMDGFISCQNLFSYSYYHLYSVKFLTKLMRLILQFSKSHYATYKTTCRNACDFIKGVFQCAFKYNFNIPQSQIKEIQQMVKIISTQGEYVFGTEEKQIKGIQYLYLEQLKNPNLHTFIINLKISARFSHYFLGKHKQEDLQDDIQDQDVEVLLQERENMFYYIFNLIYNLKVNYLTVIYAMLKNADRRHLSMLQFYFIKNQFLHFLVQDGYSLQTSDKQFMEIYYGCLGYLLKGNMIAYAILDQVIQVQAGQTNKSYFTDTLKRNFAYAKQLLLIVCSDAITANAKNPDQYIFCPEILRRLFQYQKGQTKNSVNNTKHEIWISYINTVLIHDLMSRKNRQEQIRRKRQKYLFKNYVNFTVSLQQKQQSQINHRFTKQITQWTTLIIFLHIEYTQYERANFAEEYVLGKFVMNYLTTILSVALKWKYKDEAQAMKEFLKLLQNWEINCNNTILNKQDNEDIFQTAYGGVVKFMYLKKWNRRIIKAIKLYLQSMKQVNTLK